ncbi:hypothetical protein E0H80_09565 [Acinetobacter sp. ANC 4779]|uniref:DUF6502 family protein n=1 Tax=Acinetobacter sp. ANC 4779 TaxID=2529848 RepID=UPI00103FB37F|nr:DUF6502 family protein [Acinetobacter sp. ANC 4779]TCB50072.1 hypothetical protein E0H80_09565 [Acinetobacter sp. ANC 4779]
MSNLPANDAEFNLQQVLLLMNYLTKWLIRSGVGYTDFSAALKSIFYQQAIDEIERLGNKSTVSAISLLSGLHRKDITAFKEMIDEETLIKEAKLEKSLSIPARVVGFWVAENWPEQLPFYNCKQVSFVNLVKNISLEMHPRSVLNELVRLGIVRQNGKQVILQKRSFVPDQLNQELRKLLNQNLQSHLKAGLHNIFIDDQVSFLEESVRADELTKESVEILTQYSIELWGEYSEALLKLAIERCTIDEGQSEANQTFCLGIYQSDV